MYPYVMSIEKFKNFLDKIAKTGIPEKVDGKYLKTLGFTSSNDERFLGAIKFIGLVENQRGGAPTELWKKMRVNQPEAIAEGTRIGYSELFNMYPNAEKQDNEALNSFFAGNTTLGSEAIAKIISTFRVFVELGDFSGADDSEAAEVVVETKEGEKVKVVKEVVARTSSGMTINLNIQLQVPADATGEVYDQFFASMKKNLLDE